MTDVEYNLPWEVGGPYPGVSVCYCAEPGSGFPDPAPPRYEPIAVLDSATEGEQNKTTLAVAEFIVTACNNHAALVAVLRDMLNGWKYIREFHGDLYGVGWNHCQDAAERVLKRIGEPK